MTTIFFWLRWSLFIIPYTVCWWLTFVLGWLLYGKRQPPRTIQLSAASQDAWLRAVPLRRMR